jgi:carbon-monoxide dehydrogenase medium subunit
MKPARFSYAVPETAQEALELLAVDEDARLMAGGQSLVPLLNMRFARPSVVIELGRVEELRAVEWQNGHVRFGAMVRQRTVETDPQIGARLPLLAAATSHIAHLAVRTRGTVGGSIAHADPAAELPATMVTLGATMIIRTADGGSRAVPAAEFFFGPFMTAIAPGELLAAIDITPPPAGTGWAFLEVARVHGAFARSGVAALLRRGTDGCIEQIALTGFGIGSKPYTPSWLDDAAIGERPCERLFAEIAARVRAEIEPSGHGQEDTEYRKRVSETLVRRALERAVETAA